MTETGKELLGTAPSHVLLPTTFAKEAKLCASEFWSLLINKIQAKMLEVGSNVSFQGWNLEPPQNSFGVS